MELSAISWIIFSINVFNFLSYTQSIENYRITYPKRMASYIDNSVNPCDDFFQYACGNYIRALRKGKSDFVLTAEKQIRNFMHNVLMEPLKNTGKDFSAEDKAKMFYQSCIKVDHFKYPKSEAFLRLFDSVGGWPAVDPKWNPDNFDWFQFELLAATYGGNIFIYEGISSDESVMYLTANRFYLNNVVNLFQPYSREFQLAKGIAMRIMKMYGVRKSSAKRIWNEIVEFGKLWKSFDVSHQWEDVSSSIDSITSLMEIVPIVDWEDYIKVKFGNYTTLDPDRLEIYNIRRLNNIGKLFKKNERAAANYAAIVFLFELHDDLKAERYNQQFCYNKLSNYLNPIEAALFFARNPEEGKIEEEIRTMVEYIRNAYRQKIREANWLSREVKQRLIDKVNNIYVKFPEELHFVDFEALNREYSNLEVYPENDYYENFLAVRVFSQQRKHLKFLLRQTIKDANPIEVNAYYIYKSNSIGLLAGMIQKPYYFEGFPSAYNFGGVGTVLAHEFGHALGPADRYYDKLGEIFTWDDFSEEGYYQREICFLNHYNAIPLMELYEPHNATISLNENIAECLGVRTAYLAYQKWLKMFRNSLDMTKQTLPGLNLTSDQLFFLSYGQQYCTKLTRDEIIASQKEEHGPKRIALVGSVSNFDEFSKAFNCELGTPMNPKEKCTLF